MLNKPKNTGATKPQQSVSDYIQGRINSAAESGFSSTKIWIKNASFAEAKNILEQADFKYNEVLREPNSVQLEVTW